MPTDVNDDSKLIAVAAAAVSNGGAEGGIKVGVLCVVFLRLLMMMSFWCIDDVDNVYVVRD